MSEYSTLISLALGVGYPLQINVPLLDSEVGGDPECRNLFTYLMASKRKCVSPIPGLSSEDSDIDLTTQNFPRFIVIQSTDKLPITKVSPFVIEKSIKGLIGTVDSVKKIKNDCLLIETNRKQISDKILKLSEFCSLKVKTFPHSSLNFSKGVIRCPDLSGLSEEEILAELTPQGVSGVRRISFSKDGKRIPTNTLVLTFNNPKLPFNIKVGYLIVRVQVYIPNPLRCFDCQKFGHHESSCTNTHICGRCGENAHTPNIECQAEPKCPNCSGPHDSRSRECPTWKFEKEVLKLKYTLNISFPDARKQVKDKISSKTSYAAITKSNTSLCQDSSTQYETPSGDQVSDKIIVPTKYKVSESTVKQSTQPKSNTSVQSSESLASSSQPASMSKKERKAAVRAAKASQEASSSSGKTGGPSPPNSQGNRVGRSNSVNRFDCLMETESPPDKPSRSPIKAPK